MPMTHKTDRNNGSAHDAVIVNGFRAPPPPARRPLAALISVIRLVRNKEDTSLVFKTVTALAGDAGLRQFERFTGTAYGRAVVSEPICLEHILSDRDWLATLPADSFGRAYLDFMVGEDLTPDGLLASAAEAGVDYSDDTDFPEYMRMFTNQAVMHDVFHVLTGYGRDALGELCNLAFSNQQHFNRGLRLIIRIGLIAQKIEAPRAPLMKAIRQGREMGQRADYVLGHDIRTLLPLPLTEVRRKLNIIEPTIYNAVPQALKDGLLQPKTGASGAAATLSDDEAVPA